MTGPLLPRRRSLLHFVGLGGRETTNLLSFSQWTLIALSVNKSTNRDLAAHAPTHR
jgi:hypothetical protein